MAKQRMIRPEIWTSQQVDSLSDFEFRVYVGMISLADDEGRLSANPNVLAAAIFPLRGDTDLPGKIKNAVQAIEHMTDTKDGTPLIGIYQIGQEAFVFHPKWEKSQKIPKTRRSASRIPRPPIGKKYIEARKAVTANGY